MALDPRPCPRLATGVRLKHDAGRDQWVLLAPERVFVLDAVALEIVRRCDGKTPLEAIIDDLANAYSAERTTIAGDVEEMLADLGRKGAVQL